MNTDKIESAKPDEKAIHAESDKLKEKASDAATKSQLWELGAAIGVPATIMASVVLPPLALAPALMTAWAGYKSWKAEDEAAELGLQAAKSRETEIQQADVPARRSRINAGYMTDNQAQVDPVVAVNPRMRMG